MRGAKVHSASAWRRTTRTAGLPRALACARPLRARRQARATARERLWPTPHRPRETHREKYTEEMERAGKRCREKEATRARSCACAPRASVRTARKCAPHARTLERARV
eukprot:2344101-Pleurochrysis_carterae.AAC.1